MTIKDIEVHIANIKKLKDTVPEESKVFIGNIERGLEVIRSGYIITDVLACVRGLLFGNNDKQGGN